MRSILATMIVLTTVGCSEPPPLEIPDMTPVPDLWSAQWQPCGKVASECKPNFACMEIYGPDYAYCTNYCGDSTPPPGTECPIGAVCTRVTNLTGAGAAYVQICTKVNGR